MVAPDALEQPHEDADGVLHFFMSTLEQIDPFWIDAHSEKGGFCPRLGAVNDIICTDRARPMILFFPRNYSGSPYDLMSAAAIVLHERDLDDGLIDEDEFRRRMRVDTLRIWPSAWGLWRLMGDQPQGRIGPIDEFQIMDTFGPITHHNKQTIVGRGWEGSD